MNQGSEFSMYSVVIYANSNSTSYAFTTSVYFLFVTFEQQTINAMSYMAIYALVSTTIIESINYYSSDLVDFWSLFYIWSGTIELYNTTLRYLTFCILFHQNISSNKKPPLINTIGTNVTVKNCIFDNIIIPQTSSLFQFSDKGTYYSQLPYVYNQNFAHFENVTFNGISAYYVPNPPDPSLLTLPLLIYGSHSTSFPVHYTLINLTITNNFASIFYCFCIYCFVVSFKLFYLFHRFKHLFFNFQSTTSSA